MASTPGTIHSAAQVLMLSACRHQPQGSFTDSPSGTWCMLSQLGLLVAARQEAHAPIVWGAICAGQPACSRPGI